MADYVGYDGELADICFPALTAEQVTSEATFVWNGGLIHGDRA